MSASMGKSLHHFDCETSSNVKLEACGALCHMSKNFVLVFEKTCALTLTWYWIIRDHEISVHCAFPVPPYVIVIKDEK